MSRVTIDDGILTNVADSIRTQLGETDSISPLDFAEAILSIQGGGGMPSGMECGEVELTSNITDNLVIEHNCGRTPNMFLLWVDDFTNLTTPKYTSIACWTVIKDDGTVVPYGCKTWIISSSGNCSYTNYGGCSEVNDETITITTRANTYPFRTDLTYRWLSICW